ncbi:MAG: peptidylprolyl isomerase [Candidatus Aenigmarchaeota archaeon]|nr:peptidylprolyl isomerase [Candidatus Aenigmarchaeota archaeon]
MQKGDFVRIAYIGRLESNEIFDLTDEELAKKEKIYNPKIRYKPVPVIIGTGFVIPGLDKALLEMKVGEKKKILIEPEEGFGKRDPKLTQIVPRSAFREMKTEPKQGMIVDFSGVKGRIQSVAAGRVTIDFNNPLSGKKLIYELELKEKIEDDLEKIKAVFEFFGIDGVDAKICEASVDIETKPLLPELKQRISSVIIENLKPAGKTLSKIRFIEVYEKK